ncbi:hypothetical protein [Veillonella sp. Ser01]
MDWIVGHLESIIGMLVTGIVSIFAMYKANNQNYQLAFYQKVIDKRLKAYELVEELLEKLDIFDATTEQMYYISNPILIRDLIPYFSSVMKMRIWLSKGIFDYLNLLNSLLVSYLYYINGNKKDKLIIFLEDFKELIKPLDSKFEKAFSKADNDETIRLLVQHLFYYQFNNYNCR